MGPNSLEEVKRHIVRLDRSPMNAKIWVAQLSCGHDIYLYRKPRKKELGCEICKQHAKGKSCGTK